MSNEPSINWDEVIKKEARGKNDEDLGEVQEIGDAVRLDSKGNGKQGEILHTKIPG